jgi:heat shock protein HslJ
MDIRTLRTGILATLVALFLTAGCVTINVPGGTPEPTATTPTAPTTPTPTTPTPTTPTTPTMPTIPTVPTIPTTPTIIPTLPVKPTVPIIPTLPLLHPSLSGTEWILDSMGAPGHLIPALAIKDVTLRFIDDERLNGSAGCNSYSGEYESTLGGELKVSDITSTLMLCTQPGLMDQENDFLDALDEAESYDVVGGKLQIITEGKVLVFSAS